MSSFLAHLTHLTLRPSDLRPQIEEPGDEIPTTKCVGTLKPQTTEQSIKILSNLKHVVPDSQKVFREDFFYVFFSITALKQFKNNYRVS